MELIIKTELRQSLHSLYRITYKNGYVYVGSCSSTKYKGRKVGKNYFGSSSVALKYGWRRSNKSENIDFNKSQISFIEVWFYSNEEWTPHKESEFINKEAAVLGIADCAEILTKYKKWTSKYKKHGKLLNVQDNTAVNLRQAALIKYKSEGPTKLQREVSQNLIKYHSASETKEVRQKAVTTRRKNNPEWANEFVKKGQLVCHTKEVLEKSSKTKKSKRLRYKLNDGFVGDYEQIAEHLNVHKVTVAKWLRGKIKLPRRVGIWEFENVTTS